MSISGIQSGYAIIQQSTNMAEEAAIELNQAAQDTPESNDFSQSSDLSFNQIEPEKSLSLKDKEPEPVSSSTDSLIKLTQSASYNRVGASVVDRQNEAIGSLLDIHI
ncbi:MULTISPECIES: hypothetical protein [Vibrio]|uniref:Uncharacterized protein n=1 Tax=Vibrio lentus TaxID=136468 RepID=A0A1B9PT11_9VIBR|nr:MULTISPECIES: hypothetical protein [Vibrio]OCH48368.1 hypothetical protein A6E08_09460 [Vibrio lentus]PME48760.1 hypothetical protein BCV34_15145 [Vibrio lentus]PME60373.1 hypothetical protein BCV30_13010 [Vibrio lentus]PME79660.1 hypothetical protein BCV27_17140 [Vibrio lentus]PMG77836.1 hypothetical protein BCU86_21370 [Vibrio lentus]